jgi:hypothetical protein
MSTPPVYNFGIGGYGNVSGIRGLPLAYYTGLFTSQYQQSSNLLSWAKSLLQHYDNVSRCLAEIIWNFDIDNAVGVQLDILGNIIGQSRILPFLPSNGVSPVLDDGTYRILLKAKAASNHWDGTIDSLQTTWQMLFPGGSIVIEDGQNMTATVIIGCTFSSIIQDLILHGYIVPRPAGVLYSYTITTLPVLGFDENNTYVGGLDRGHFA